MLLCHQIIQELIHENAVIKKTNQIFSQNEKRECELLCITLINNTPFFFLLTNKWNNSVFNITEGFWCIWIWIFWISALNFFPTKSYLIICCKTSFSSSSDIGQQKIVIYITQKNGHALLWRGSSLRQDVRWKVSPGDGCPSKLSLQIAIRGI